MTFDPSTAPINLGRWCSKCGSQSFAAKATACQLCGGKFLRWRPPRERSAKRDPSFDELFEPRGNSRLSPKQADILLRHGYPIDVSKAKASQIILTLKANGWKRPPDSHQID